MGDKKSGYGFMIPKKLEVTEAGVPHVSFILEGRENPAHSINLSIRGAKYLERNLRACIDMLEEDGHYA